MSYGFQVKAATKAEAKAAVQEKFDEVAAQQPMHVVDMDAARKNACAVIDLLPDFVVDKDISVSCNGYVSWTGGTADPTVVTGVSIACSAAFVDRK